MLVIMHEFHERERKRTEGDFHACNYSIETWEGRGVKLCNIIHLITSFMANNRTQADILHCKNSVKFRVKTLWLLELYRKTIR